MGTGQTCTKTLLHGGSLCMKGHFYTRVKTVKYKTLQKKNRKKQKKQIIYLPRVKVMDNSDS